MATQKQTRSRRRAQDTADDDVFGKLVPYWVRQEILPRFGELLRAALDAAIGVRHVYTTDPRTQQWTRLTDPDAIAAILNSPDGGVRDGWMIYTTDPDVDLLRTLLAAQFGTPFDQADVPDLVRVLLQDPETNEVVTLGERLQQLRAGPRAPQLGLFDDHDDRIH